MKINPDFCDIVRNHTKNVSALHIKMRLLVIVVTVSDKFDIGSSLAVHAHRHASYY